VNRGAFWNYYELENQQYQKRRAKFLNLHKQKRKITHQDKVLCRAGY
jgi:hypothetical protein